MRHPRLLTGAGLVLSLALVACAQAPTPTPPPLAASPPVLTDGAIHRVAAGSAAYSVEVVSTAPSLELGLSGRAELAPGTGMLFDLGSELETSFWMRGMRFPLDIVWARGDWIVVAVSANAPPPAPGTPDADLPLYSPGQPVRFVLEVPAGEAAAHAIAPGVRLRVYER